MSDNGCATACRIHLISLSTSLISIQKYQGLMKYESYYKKLDLYYQFSVRMGKIVEEDWLENERDKTQAKIMQLLSKSKDEYIIRCRYCGRILPIGNSRNICRDCYSMIRR